MGKTIVPLEGAFAPEEARGWEGKIFRQVCKQGQQKALAYLEELEESQAEVLVLLGDKPIQWFLKFYEDTWKRLLNFPRYGQLYPVEIDGRSMEILPLAHPRQIARLGSSSQKWYDLHQEWLESTPSKIIE
jgi:hypothetical protein